MSLRGWEEASPPRGPRGGRARTHAPGFVFQQHEKVRSGLVPPKHPTRIAPTRCLLASPMGLVVDDDPLFRSVIARELPSTCRIIEAPTGRSAMDPPLE